jgi:hypothetical protein
MAYDALRTIMPIAGWPEERAREVEISVGADPALPTRFCIGPAGAAPRGPSDSRAGQHPPIIDDGPRIAATMPSPRSAAMSDQVRPA